MRTGRNMDVGRVMRCGVHFMQKSANKREQGQTCLRFAERKQILRKKILQILSNLANLYSGFFQPSRASSPRRLARTGTSTPPVWMGFDAIRESGGDVEEWGRCGRVGRKKRAAYVLKVGKRKLGKEKEACENPHASLSYCRL